MKRLFFILSIIGFAYILSPKSPAAPNPVISDVGMQFAFFYSSLAPHGEWIEVESGIRVWRPFHISHLWRPYLGGRWVWTDYGWYWMSDEPFGWITYHYGRWYYDDYYGWVWIPDDVWAPAWVEWRYNDDYIGWAPLPPYASFNMVLGIRFTTRWLAPAHYWNVVHFNRFGSIIRYRDTAPEDNVRRLIHTGRTGSQNEVDHERIINRGVDKAIIERRGNLQFTRTEVRETHERPGERMTRSNDNQRVERIEVYRPTQDEMKHSTGRIDVRHGERNLSIHINKVERSRGESRPPQVRGRQSQRERLEMRRELIQRYERKQKLSPPAMRGPWQHRIEQRKERSRIAQPHRSNQDRQSENKGERRRGK